MQCYGRPNPKPSLTWGFVRVFALHKIRYGTTRPAGVRLQQIIQPDGLRAAVPDQRQANLQGSTARTPNREGRGGRCDGSKCAYLHSSDRS